MKLSRQSTSFILVACILLILLAIVAAWFVFFQNNGSTNNLVDNNPNIQVGELEIIDQDGEEYIAEGNVLPLTFQQTDLLPTFSPSTELVYVKDSNLKSYRATLFMFSTISEKDELTTSIREELAEKGWSEIESEDEILVFQQDIYRQEINFEEKGAVELIVNIEFNETKNYNPA